MSNKYFKHMRTIQEIKVNAGAINDARFDEDYPLVKVRKARVRHNLPDAWNDIPAIGIVAGKITGSSSIVKTHVTS